ncbi:MAG: phosphate transporter family protein [Proteobacteria bacterium]|nr:phosphate transporter family protein [Pseudomonadota bacterium]
METLALPLLVGLIGIALLFDFLNGLHDAANSIATIVSTRVLRPQYAVFWAAFFNFIAFLFFGLHVATTLGKGIIDPAIITPHVVFAALMGAIIWNIVTWLAGIPSSSSHALVGGLVGAGLAKTGFSAIVWSGLLKTSSAIFLSPAFGFFLALMLVLAVSWTFVKRTPFAVDKTFRHLQFVSASLYSLGHGGNDAQKTMGIIAVLLYSQGYLGGEFHIPFWVVIACQSAMALGTLMGGWRIVHTMGSKITQPDARLLCRDRRRHHPVRRHALRHPGIDHPHDHWRHRRRRCRTARLGGALGYCRQHRHRLGHHAAGRCGHRRLRLLAGRPVRLTGNARQA